MRSIAVSSILATLALSACGTPSTNYGLWVVQLATPEIESASDCSENFDEARCPEADDGGSSDWTIENTSDVSPRIEFVEILSGQDKSDVAFLAFRGQLFPGTATDDGFTFEWKNQVASQHSEDYNGDYEYSHDVDSTITTKFAMTLGDEPGTMGGTVTQVLNATESTTESDTTDNEDVIFTLGQINNASLDALENTANDEDPDGRINTADNEECGDRNCEISTTQTLTSKSKIKATYALDQSNGDVSDYQEIDQSEGVEESDLIFDLGF
jgi:hypothetical protein